MTTQMTKLVTVAEACEELRIRRTKLYELLGTGELPSMTIGRRRLIPASALDALIEARTTTHFVA